jgi:hypothetical protein
MATAKQPAPPTPEQLTYIVACELDVTLAGLSPEQRLDVLKRLHDSILRRLEREQLRSDQEWTRSRPIALGPGVSPGLFESFLARQLVRSQPSAGDIIPIE